MIAAFRRSFYVALGGEVICVGPPSFGAGPLNLLASDLKGPGAADDWTEDLDVGAPAYARGDALVVAGLEIRHRGLAPWTPPDPQERDKCALARGLARLAKTMRRRDAPALGVLVAPFCDAGADIASVTLGHGFLPDTARTIAAARDWAGREGEGELPRFERLVGLGPGLTPSGDDFLCGFMVASGGWASRPWPSASGIAWRDDSHRRTPSAPPF